MRKESFDLDWRFSLGDEGQAAKAYDDASWRRVDLPHDWSIELPRSKDNPTGASGGYAREGVGWYRKHFDVPREWAGRRVRVEFEGVYRDAEVWLNGRAVGVHPYGYTTFSLDLTPLLKPGETNVLAVRVSNTPHGHTRWYSGSGLYRHVWLLTAPPVHVAPWGLSVTTPDVTGKVASVAVETAVENLSPANCAVIVRWRVMNPEGEMVAKGSAEAAVKAGDRAAVQQRLSVRNPRLWSPDTPSLYRLETEIFEGRTRLDGESTAFGIRNIAFNPEQGFVLNGVSLKMRGGCVHHDCGPLGAASIDRAEERKVEVLKASGFNAVRCAHNPPSPAFLEACDRLGMLVIDEAFDCWRAGKNHQDYHRHFDKGWREDLDSMVRRDRNHPSVVLWSIGNELVERGEPEGAAIAGMLAQRVRELDPTRPVTAGICDIWGGTVPAWETTDGLLAQLDVCGYNYRLDVYRSDHERFPKRVILATETFPPFHFQYDYWKACEELPYVAGDFVWTALDYLGEAGIGHTYLEGDKVPQLPGWPYTVANCGDIDLCGFKRPQSYYRDVLWKRAKTPYIAVHTPVPDGRKVVVSSWGWDDVQASWTWPGQDGKPMSVDVYFDCDEIELRLNGRPLGRSPAGAAAKHKAVFSIPYEPGEIRAVAFQNGKPVAESALDTAGVPHRLRLTPDRAAIRSDRNDLSYVSVELCDRKGRVIPTAADLVQFSLKGPGRIAAVANADPKNAEPFTGRQHKLWRGRGLVVVQPDGRLGALKVQAMADGVDVASVTITIRK
jgi:beta-galactosidase